MQLRDKLNSKEGYQEIISRNEKYISEIFDDIKKINEAEEKGIQLYNRPNLDAIDYNLNDLLKYKYDVFIAGYSLGKDIEDLKSEYNSILSYMEKRWKKSNGFVQMVWMLSIGIMLEIDDSEFEKLAEAVRQDNPMDFLIDFLLNYRLPSWEIKSNKFLHKLPYSGIQEIISLSKIDKTKALERLKKYLVKEWYRGHSDTGWYNDHKSKGNQHKGYWSFESGALVKILGLDDSSLKETQYYPYDMVHWKD